jgi:thioredoxin 2
MTPEPKSAAQTHDVTYAACPQCSKLNKISLARVVQAKPTCGSCKTEIDLVHGILNATTVQLQATIAKSPIPVMVDFWAPWCGPCRAFAPTYERVAKEFAGQSVFVKINTEAHAASSQIYGIRGIPTLAVFRQGREVDRLGGALPYVSFRPWVVEKISGSVR